MTAFAHPSHIPVEVLAEVLQPDPYAMEKAGYLLEVWRDIPAVDVERVFWTLDAIVNAGHAARPIHFSVGRGADYPLFVETMWLTQSPNEPTLSYWRGAEGYKWFVSAPIFPSQSAVFSPRAYPELTMAAIHAVLRGHHSVNVVTRAYVFVKSTLDPDDYVKSYLEHLAPTFGRVYVNGEYQLYHWPTGDVRTAPALVLDRYNGVFSFERVADVEERLRAQLDAGIVRPSEPMRTGLAPNLAPGTSMADWVIANAPSDRWRSRVEAALSAFPGAAETLRMFSGGERFVLLSVPDYFSANYVQVPLLFDDADHIAGLGPGWRTCFTGDAFDRDVGRIADRQIAIYPRHISGGRLGFFLLSGTQPVYWYMKLHLE